MQPPPPDGAQHEAVGVARLAVGARVQAARVQPRRARTAQARPDGPVQRKKHLAHLGETPFGHGFPAHARAHLVQIGQLAVVRQTQKRLKGNVRLKRAARWRDRSRCDPSFRQGFKAHLAGRFQPFQLADFYIQAGERGGQAALAGGERFALSAQDIQRIRGVRQEQKCADFLQAQPHVLENQNMVQHFQLVRAIVAVAVVWVLFIGRKHARTVVKNQRLLGNAVEARQLAGGKTGLHDGPPSAQKGG